MDDKRTARLGFAPRRLLRYTSSSPPSSSSSLFRQARGTGVFIPAYAKLMKTFLCRETQWPSQRRLPLFPLTSHLPTPFRPHSRWTEVKAKPCSLRASLLQCRVCAYEMAKFFYRTGTFKAARSSAEVDFFFLSVVLLHGEMGVRGRSERLK